MTTEMDGSGPLVSVIVPVYKVEEYLDECVQSILGQTHKNLEIILVDDGSPDRCGEICDGYAARDPRVRVIHQENAGCAAARNTGIKAARGGWLMFVDSDDWLEEDAVELLYKKALTSGCDIIACSYYCNYQDRQISCLPEGSEDYCFPARSYRDCLIGTVLCMPENYRGLFPAELSRLGKPRTPWMKLYRTELVKSRKIEFPLAFKTGQDMIFNLRAASCANGLFFCAREVYHYRLRTSSATHGGGAERVEREFRSIPATEAILRELGVRESMEKFMLYFAMGKMIDAVMAFGRQKHSLDSAIDGGKVLREQIERSPLCLQALRADLRPHKKARHRIFLWFLRHRLYGFACFACVMYYKFFPEGSHRGCYP